MITLKYWQLLVRTVTGWTDCMFVFDALVKPGRCALPQSTPMCAEYCYHDGQCPGEQKCCRTTCGHACSEPCWSVSYVCTCLVSLVQRKVPLNVLRSLFLHFHRCTLWYMFRATVCTRCDLQETKESPLTHGAKLYKKYGIIWCSFIVTQSDWVHEFTTLLIWLCSQYIFLYE